MPMFLEFPGTESGSWFTCLSEFEAREMTYQSGVNLLYLSWELTLKLNCQKQVTSLLMKIPRELQRQTTWVGCECHSGVNRLCRAWRKPSAQEGGRRPTKFLYFSTLRSGSQPLLPSDPGSRHGAGSRIAYGRVLSQSLGIGSSWAGVLSLAPLSSWRPLGRYWQSLGDRLKKFCLLGKVLGRVLSGNFPLLWQNLEQMFDWNHLH